MRLVPFLSGQLLGGFAEPFHCFQILPHGFHGKRVRLLSGGQLVDFPLPCLRGDCLAVVFQFFQIPVCCVIEDQFPAVALLEQFPLLRLYPGKLLVDSLILLRDALTASYFVAVWKMLRKKGCVPSALTQNVKDLLASREIEAILDNTDFMILLSQAQSDRAILAKQLGISEHQLSYITHTAIRTSCRNALL